MVPCAFSGGTRKSWEENPMMAAAQNTNKESTDLRFEDKMRFIEQPLGEVPDPDLVSEARIKEYYTKVRKEQEVACRMLCAMSLDFQILFEPLGAYDMIQQLKTMFQEQGKGYLDTLEYLSYPMPLELAVSFILNSLNKDFESLVQTYNLHSMGKTLVELHAIQKSHEKGIPKKVDTLAVMAIKVGRIQKDRKGKKPHVAKGKKVRKTKLAYAPNQKIPPPPKKDNPAKDSKCHICKEVGYWKRNYPKYLAELKKRKNASGASSSSIFTIDLYAFSNNKSWMYDTGCGIHIYNTSQGLRGSRKLKHEALSLYVGNGMRATVEAIRCFDLRLSNRQVIVLNNCHYAPSITRGVVSFSRLIDDGFINVIRNNVIFISKDNVLYFNAIPVDCIYEIDLHGHHSNDSSIFNVSRKRAKHALDSTYLWHCRLGHASKKRIEKLQHDGILNPTDVGTFDDKCKTCVYGKMARKPFTHVVERAKDLLELIHTDICGPFRIMSREGASYFITFTNDFNRYGYVYLLKHKHEVFETFKEFQNEVENQLGKKIKVIRSDIGGKYMSFEFVEHLKKCCIVSHLTPPYTPQNNGMSERRNQTLLDMVRSMMNSTTLPKSFWGYALESATRILNMIPTKKVDKTPYEVWHRKVPKLYPKETIGYYFYYPIENKIFVARNAEFFKNSLIEHEASRSTQLLGVSKSTEELDFIQEENTLPSGNTSLRHDEVEHIDIKPQHVDVPIHRSARTSQAPERYGFYIDAEEHELGDHDNQVWCLVDLPPGGRTIGNKRLFNKKTDMDGIIHTFKARLIEKGFTQIYGLEYEETFSPVADIRAIRILLAIASGSNVTFLILYVDDILIMGNNIPMLQELKSWLCKCFSMKDLREAAYILGIKITRDRSKRLLHLSQSAYFDKILKKYRMDKSKRGFTPMQEKLDFRKNTQDMVLVYGAKPEAELRVKCYIDASFQTDKDDTKSQTGYVFVLNGGAVDSKSAKQSIIAMSSTEVEYVAVAEASMEAIWI
ncbi:retrotransposon protein, putative, ty1-copia subclass, partial [Tanacetum coccineum]